MHILTVTCLKDKRQFTLQLHSIKKYLRGSFKHFIVINDTPQSLTKKIKKSWYRSVQEIYEGIIDYEIFFAKWNEDWGLCDYGWKSQQVFKLYFYEIIKKDYVILDSKNFFIRPMDVAEFENICGSGKLDHPGPHFDHINNLYAKEFNCEPIKKPLSPTTPFVISYDVLKNYAEPYDIAQRLYSLKINNHDWPSEFIFYSYLVKEQLDEVEKPIISATAWYPSNLNWWFDIILNNNSIKIVGIHKNVKKNLTKKTRDKIRKLLLNFGLPDTL